MRLELSSVSVSLGARPILDQASARFDAGSIHVVRGPSGVGKSTLLNVIAGYITPCSGRVQDAGPVGYLLQEETLFSPLTVRQNLEIMWRARSREALPPQHAVRQLSDFGVDQLMDEVVEKLSGGERRRVEIAGLLLHAPPVLLLDEPAATLDSTNASQVYEGLWRNRRDRVTMIASHDHNGRWPGDGPVYWTIEDRKLTREI